MTERPIIAILGNGCAAAECVQALRENGHTGRIRMFADNGDAPFNPTLTTYYAAGRIGYRGLFPFGADREFYERWQVETELNSRVVSLDTKDRTVTNQTGVRAEYDRCLIATGATPIRPKLPGIDSPRVLTMRTLQDAEALRSALQSHPRRAVVVGASMVGIKLVELFVNLGIEVCLADMAPQLFPTIAHPDCAAVLRQRLEARGVRLRLGSAIAGIEGAGTGVRAFFSGDDTPEEADLLLMCIGVRPNLGFLDGGIAVDKGVLVDEYLRTNLDGVYAAGDVAQGRNVLTGKPQMIGLWAAARYQGRAAGCHLAGRPLPYPGEVPHNVTHFLGMTFFGIGDTGGGTRSENIDHGSGYAQLFWAGERLVGANLIDHDETAGALRHAIVKECLAGEAGEADVRELFDPAWSLARIRRAEFLSTQRLYRYGQTAPR